MPFQGHEGQNNPYTSSIIIPSTISTNASVVKTPKLSISTTKVSTKTTTAFVQDFLCGNHSLPLRFLWGSMRSNIPVEVRREETKEDGLKKNETRGRWSRKGRNQRKMIWEMRKPEEDDLRKRGTRGRWSGKLGNQRNIIWEMRKPEKDDLEKRGTRGRWSGRERIDWIRLAYILNLFSSSWEIRVGRNLRKRQFNTASPNISSHNLRVIREVIWYHDSWNNIAF